MTAPFFTQRQHVAVKIESTEGTDAVPADADVVAPAFDISFEPTIDSPERPVIQSSFSRLPRVTGERSAVISFTVELKGASAAGTVPPQLSAPLRACGFGETIVGGISVTYAPVSAALDSATVEIREGSTASATNKVKKIVGARGTVEIVAGKGQRVMANFTFTGRYVEPTETTQFVTPVAGVAPQPFLGAAFTFQTVGTLKIENCTLDIGNNVVMQNDVNQASGNFSAVIVGRIPVGSINPQQELIATINFFNNFTTNVEGTLSYVLGTVAGNIITVTALKAQIVGLSEGDREGLRTNELELQLNQSVQAGDDELTIAFT